MKTVKMNGRRSNHTLFLYGSGGQFNWKRVPPYFTIEVDMDSVEEREASNGSKV